MKSETYSVVVPAAGVGKRMQANKPKQYLELAGKTILEHTLERLLSHPAINNIYLALGVDDPYFQQLKIATHPNIIRVDGGKERSDSVLSALNAMPQNHQWVLVHDAARPCLTHQDLDKLLALATDNTGGILATRVRDTMKRSDNLDQVLHTESRDNLWHALTPQFFPLEQLRTALQQALSRGVEVTDEASAIEWAGGEVKLVEACASNIKITKPEDLQLAEFYLTMQERIAK